MSTFNSAVFLAFPRADDPRDDVDSLSLISYTLTMTDAQLKPLRWTGSAKKDLLKFPEKVQNLVGFALYFAQRGDKHPSAFVMKGFGAASVLEVIEDHDGDTYRAVYTVRFRDAIWVLHCFQKKSKHGIATPSKDST